jgi:hypothetical protein
MPVISATGDVEVKGLQSKASPGKTGRPYLNNKLKIKRARGIGPVRP